MWILSLLMNKRIVFPVLMGLAIVTVVSGVYLRGHANGYSKGIGECNYEKQETINENLRIKEKVRSIRRLVNDDAYIERLRNGSI